MVSLTEYRKMRRDADVNAVNHAFARICRTVLSQVIQPEAEVRVVEGRRWRFDFAWPEYQVAVELQGSTHARGRHTRGIGYQGDCEKLNTAQCEGWLVLWFTTQDVQDLKRRRYLIWTICRALALRGCTKPGVVNFTTLAPPARAGGSKGARESTERRPSPDIALGAASTMPRNDSDSPSAPTNSPASRGRGQHRPQGGNERSE